MRPKSLEWFDRIFYLSTAIAVITGLVNLSSVRDQLMAQETADNKPLMVAAISIVLGIAINAAIWFFVSRRANRIAIGLWVVLNLFTVLTVPKLVKTVVAVQALGNVPLEALLPSVVAGLVNALLACISVILLFQRDAQSWFKAQQGR